MKITITKEQLLERGISENCKEYKKFVKKFGNKAKIKWTLETQLELLRHRYWRRHFGWIVSVGLLPMWSMVDVDLSGANLKRAYLGGTNLSNAILSDANLSGANLSGANLSMTNLGGANLSQANLSNANLSWADFGSADLSMAYLVGANLSMANLGDANLTLTDLNNVIYSESTVWPEAISVNQTAPCVTRGR